MQETRNAWGHENKRLTACWAGRVGKADRRGQRSWRVGGIHQHLATRAFLAEGRIYENVRRQECEKDFWNSQGVFWYPDVILASPPLGSVYSQGRDILLEKLGVPFLQHPPGSRVCAWLA